MLHAILNLVNSIKEDTLWCILKRKHMDVPRLRSETNLSTSTEFSRSWEIGGS
jgi:hypothetical protein